jgi:hypothetical protein
MQPNAYQAEIAMLRRDLDEARAMIEFLSKPPEVNFDTTLRNMYGLTAGQTRMMAVLAKGGPRSRLELDNAYNNDCERYERNADSQIKRIRAQIKLQMGRHPHIKIGTIYGVGYELTDESLALVRHYTAKMRQG